MRTGRADTAEFCTSEMDAAAIEHLKAWIGRGEQAEEVVSAARVAALAATLDQERLWPAAGTPLPPLWHWMLCAPAVRRSQLGADGHPRRGGFLPPVPLPRRLWAGGRIDFLQPLRVGDAVRRESRILTVEHKCGRSGDLVRAERFAEIRDGVRAVCADFPDAYFRRIDAERGYPDDFVEALIRGGWLAAMIPFAYVAEHVLGLPRSF